MPIVEMTEEDKRMLARFFSSGSRGVSLAEFNEFWDSLTREDKLCMIAELLFD
jgi:hypothetical protein